MFPCRRGFSCRQYRGFAFPEVTIKLTVLAPYDGVNPMDMKMEFDYKITLAN